MTLLTQKLATLPLFLVVFGVSTAPAQTNDNQVPFRIESWTTDNDCHITLSVQSFKRATVIYGSLLQRVTRFDGVRFTIRQERSS